jgi:hypothetical protein
MFNSINVLLYYIVTCLGCAWLIDRFLIRWLDLLHLYGQLITTSNYSAITICTSPYGGGIEYLHRDPASRRRRRKGKSQMWDSKIWSRDPRDSDQRKIALSRASSIYKSQTRPLVREGAPQEEDRNCHRNNKDLVVSPKWVLYTKTDWPADRRS